MFPRREESYNVYSYALGEVGGGLDITASYYSQLKADRELSTAGGE